MNRALDALKMLAQSKTMWGMVILLLNSYFGKAIDPALGIDGPDAITNVVNAIGALLVVFGRLTAKPLPPAEPKA